ncbi:hypothetical protein M3Y97_00086700 [Aphelenchoides bicaudatus]|nr:hypothetical protein M3Y97_00086700 [Aphelenchoides bicaudatus]
MDPVTIFSIVAGALFLVICYAIFNFATQESGFDKNYNKSKLVVVDEKTTAKGKTKNVKVKKIVKIEKRGSVEKQEVLVKPEPSASISTTSSDPLVNKAESEKSDNSVDQNEAVTSSKAPTKKNKKQVKKTGSLDSNSEAAPTTDETKTTSSNKDVGQPVEKKSIVQEKAQPKVRGKRDTSNPKSVNMERLIAHLSNSEDTGSEYVSFVRQLAEQNRQKEAKFNESVLKLRQENSSKDREIEHLHEQLYNAQIELVKARSLEQTLEEEKQKYKLFEATVNPKLMENHKLRETIRNMESSFLTHKNSFSSSADKLKRESEQIVTHLRNSLTHANNQIHQKDAQIKHLEEDIKHKISIFNEKESQFGQHSHRIEELSLAIAQKDRLIGKIQEDLAHTSRDNDRLNNEIKQLEHQLITEKNNQNDLANAKLEAELKESLQRIEELRSKNFKLVDSINTLYSYNKGNENKKPFDQELQN